jgi:hypothetical protein
MHLNGRCSTNAHSLFFLCLSKKKEQPTKDFECLMFQVDELRFPDATEGSDMLAPTEKEVWRCLDGSNDSMYSIEGVSDTFFEENDVSSGETVLKISSAFKMKAESKGKGNKLVLDPGATIAISKRTKNRQSSTQKLRRPQQRELYMKEGSPRVLVVRVISSITGDAPTKSASQLSDEIFGTNVLGDTVNLVSKCGVDSFSRKYTLFC